LYARRAPSATEGARTDGARTDGALLLLAVALAPVSATAAEAAAQAERSARAALTGVDGRARPEDSVAALRARHEAWWAAWWPAGGWLTLDHAPLESFFYLQLYKFASGGRAGRGVHDLMGPWHIVGTPWPDLHWDLNVQQTYYLPTEANRPGLMEPLRDYLKALLASGALDRNVVPAWQHDSAEAPNGASSLSGRQTCNWGFQAWRGPGWNATMPCESFVGDLTSDPGASAPAAVGNLMWALSLVERGAAYAGDDAALTEVVCPLLRRNLRFLQRLSRRGADGALHLPPTLSPEYPGAAARDPNYSLSLYRWGLATALRLSADLPGVCGRADERAGWRGTLASLAALPVDEASGTLEIYAGVPYAVPHRHYSHLFSVWPLHLLDLANGTQRAIARASVDRWLATPELDSMFYRPAASAMSVRLGDVEAAFDNVTTLLDARIEGATFYREGEFGSCTETPYAGAWAVADWMVQSWNVTRDAVGPGALNAFPGPRPEGRTILDVFPGARDVVRLLSTAYEAAPSRVSAAQFWRMGSRGGALVSGKRELVSVNATHVVSRTALVAVEAPRAARGPFSFVARPRMERPLALRRGAGSGAALTEIGDGGLVEVSGMAPGETVAIFSERRPPASWTFSPRRGCPADFHRWGFPSGPSSRSRNRTGGAGEGRRAAGKQSLWPCL
jgi:hypothetical protein